MDSRAPASNRAFMQPVSLNFSRAPEYTYRMRRILATLVLLAACTKSDGGGTGVTPVASVQLGVPTTTISIGQQITLTATTLDASGTALTGRAVSWASSAPA